MNDNDRIPKTDFPSNYDGKFGYPTLTEIKPLLPDYFKFHKGTWADWDMANKQTVLMRWIDIQETIAWKEREVKQLAESQKRYAAETKAKEEREEAERLERLAKQSDKQAQREHGKAIVAMQSECSERKKIDAAIDEANEYVQSAGKLVALLRRIPANRLHEVDLDAFLFNCGRVKQIVNPPSSQSGSGDRIRLDGFGESS